MTAELEFSAGLSASIGDLAAELRAQRRQAAARAGDCWYIQPPAILLPAGSPYVFAPQQWGPSTGYCWAIQRLTFSSPTDTDNVTVYRGHTAADVSPMNALNTLAQPGYLAAVTWHPGRVGLLLMPDESLVFSGTIASGQAVISCDAIQVTSANLPALLL